MSLRSTDVRETPLTVNADMPEVNALEWLEQGMGDERVSSWRRLVIVEVLSG